MAEEKNEQAQEAEFSLDSLAEFGSGSNDQTINIDEEEVVLAEDLEGFAKGFPNWDLLPPKN